MSCHCMVLLLCFRPTSTIPNYGDGWVQGETPRYVKKYFRRPNPKTTCAKALSKGYVVGVGVIVMAQPVCYLIL